MLKVFFIGCGVACALYGVLLYLYSGLQFSYLLVWLCLSGLFVMLGSAVRFYLKNPERFPRWVSVSFITTLAAAAVIFVIVEVLIFTSVMSAQTGHLDYMIILGAKVNADGVSKSLKLRLDRAIEYLDENPDTILVLSGGQGSDEPVSEARAMFDYLVHQGVPGEQLLLEDRSTSTAENIAYSKRVIQNDRQVRRSEQQQHPFLPPGPFIRAEDKPLQIGVLTSDFHVFRARRIARKSGIEDVRHVKAKSDPLLLPHLCIRECFAILKDQLMGNM